MPKGTWNSPARASAAAWDAARQAVMSARCLNDGVRIGPVFWLVDMMTPNDSRQPQGSGPDFLCAIESRPVRQRARVEKIHHAPLIGDGSNDGPGGGMCGGVGRCQDIVKIPDGS